jgi:ribosome-associated protein
MREITPRVYSRPRTRAARVRPWQDDPVTIVPISDDSIRLGQFLKLAGLADSGADARTLLDEGEVKVNGEPESRRGRQLRKGDVVEVDDPRGSNSAEVG